ncbi:unnamed protein product [Anisakis simplex]|uniref:Uncharacterized protein n=1 Tax=Anisakis simplex TaxID=6269 RepID=A0A0M3J1Y8_ANISI|nr:unnamed protein product [Anisakis simplex]
MTEHLKRRTMMMTISCRWICSMRILIGKIAHLQVK